MKSCKGIALVIAVLAPAALVSSAAQDLRTPHIGYVFPAGGRQGSHFTATVGGQFLAGATTVHVSGDGVTATVVGYVKPLNQQQLGHVRKHLNVLKQKRQAEKNGNEPPPVPEDMPALPNHPWLEGLADMDLAALNKLQGKLFNKKKQLNPQLADIVELEIRIAKRAQPGDRELRVGARSGLTNPLRFQVGVLPETTEEEPDSTVVVEAPVLLNGQILPGDVDRFRLHAQKGQRLLIDTRARRLIPYLADAVPGWFQAIATLYDAEGREVGYADDHYFHPDPYFVVGIPATGEYELEIRDAIYRGREDFVYRVAVSDASSAAAPFLSKQDDGRDTPAEQEPNNQWQQAEAIRFPYQVNGRIGRPGDVDLYRFEGRADQEIVTEVFARRELHSPVDALIKLVDEQHNTIAWNDDFMEKDGHLHTGAGRLTHHADPYLMTRLPGDGTYFIRITEAQGHGGHDYTYRLRIGPPQPGFALRITPSSLSLPAGNTAPLELHVMRWDGFEEDISINLVDPPSGFKLSGATIPKGKNRIHLTLTAPPQKLAEPVVLRMEGQAKVDGAVVRLPVIPADNTMQAFLWRHLVPAQEFVVAVGARGGVTPWVNRVDREPLRIAAGGTTEIRLQAPRRPQFNSLQWKLVDAPDGITLGGAKRDGAELVLALQAARETVSAGTRENLIIEAFRTQPSGKKKTQRRSVGMLPAIPLNIVDGEG